MSRGNLDLMLKEYYFTLLRSMPCVYGRELSKGVETTEIRIAFGFLKHLNPLDEIIPEQLWSITPSTLSASWFPIMTDICSPGCLG